MKLDLQSKKVRKGVTFLFKTILITVATFYFQSGYGQDSLKEKRVVYKLKPAVDIPLVGVCAAWCGYAAPYTYNKGASSPEQIMALTPSNIDPLDRWAIRPLNHSMDRLSYYPFYAAFPLPLVFFLCGHDMRSDYLKLSFLYIEALSTTGFLGFSATYFVNKYRPYVYSTNTFEYEKESQNAKNSFYAGHVEIVAVSTFFVSTVYADYHPHSKVKWLFYALSGAATLGMGYMRLNAGMHFPSDILLGAGTGALSGILVPYFHSHRAFKNNSLKIGLD